MFVLELDNNYICNKYIHKTSQELTGAPQRTDNPKKEFSKSYVTNIIQEGRKKGSSLFL